MDPKQNERPESEHLLKQSVSDQPDNIIDRQQMYVVHWVPCVFQVQTVVWFFRKHLDNSKETRALTDHHGNKLLDPGSVPHSGDLRSRFSIRLFSLLIFRAAPEDSGIYICGSTRKDFFYGYDLDIQEARTLSSTPR